MHDVTAGKFGAVVVDSKVGKKTFYEPKQEQDGAGLKSVATPKDDYVNGITAVFPTLVNRIQKATKRDKMYLRNVMTLTDTLGWRIDVIHTKFFSRDLITKIEKWLI